jgi:hypothetical protein
MLILPKRKINISNNIIFNDKVFYSSASSIIRDPNNQEKYILITRFNFKVKNGSKTLNVAMYFDNHFNLLEKKIINYNFEEAKNRDGIEDIKLFNLNNNYYYVGTSKDSKYVVYDKATSNIFDFNKYIYNTDNLEENIINVTFPTNYKTEKNWVFFDYKSNLSLIYRWYPLQICEIKYNDKKLYLLEEKNMPDVFKNIYGSSCGFKYNNLIWFIVHTHNNIKDYLHLFVVFDIHMNLIKYSEFFKFEGKKIEFSYGLLIENDNFIITYSINDNSSFISIYDYSYINNNISWTII